MGLPIFARYLRTAPVGGRGVRSPGGEAGCQSASDVATGSVWQIGFKRRWGRRAVVRGLAQRGDCLRRGRAEPFADTVALECDGGDVSLGT